jgi:hypothetical protein
MSNFVEFEKRAPGSPGAISTWVFCFPHANEVCKDMLLSFFIFLPVLLSSHTRFTVQVNGKVQGKFQISEPTEEVGTHV